MDRNMPDLAEQQTVVPGRSCGTCTLCCKILRIAELEKPAGTWCAHCDPGKGCRAYSDRPAECRSFICHWLVAPHLGDEWKPNRSKIVLAGQGDGNRILAHVDPGSPSAWKASPYYERLKEWARNGLRSDPQVVVIVVVKGHVTVVLPDKDVDLGPFDSGRITISKTMTPAGLEYTAEKILPKQSENANALSTSSG
jgi:hypothetical protein